MLEKLLEQAGIKLDFDGEEEKKSEIVDEFSGYKINIAVVGVGGSGNNTISRLYDLGVQGADLIAMNTDAQHLAITKAHKKVLLGKHITQGKGSGGDPKVGYLAAEASAQEIAAAVDGYDLVFITAGMGNGTGTGAAPVVARIVKETARNNGRFQEPLVVSVVTFPFKTEGTVRIEKAKWGIQRLLEYSDTVIIIQNDKLLELVPKLPLQSAFRFADELIARMVKGIVETIKLNSIVNIDFADVYSIMKGGGPALIGIGESDSNNRAVDAVNNALTNKMLDVEFGSGEKALVHFTIGPDVSLEEINKAMEVVYEKLSEKSEIKWGAMVDPEMGKTVRAMVIMTGVRSPYILGNVNALTDSSSWVVPKDRRLIGDPRIEKMFPDFNGSRAGRKRPSVGDAILKELGFKEL
ncbi:cell division protein FtsZ [Pyrococcus furiosus DSM 3638]|uniref:Cell division protein FtsZ 2 n=3 Tax=Pyrococcus furiosus TaxID=2261 RepID=FTSZ2_PYRFU|nr:MULTISPECIES: cell division protein FtsZ [Pyrococcus]Q8U3E3.1 RecName: Full=Cell division protein FtsZ 2 [Pyrococcus furiosus DSM 3638]AAL80649.1 cell division protein [Pyrococcus furiosus DSM 3638]AFN03320.1 cell division protein FtsZ [Pyrococcus furiosus COM1]MDK2870156.1 cell division protein FtsZ [Pyrococcus sp.]QEK78237.1 cell division protein FtsZ [Pyrococcus furiosus DSM 3638]